MPTIGFGTWELQGPQAHDAVADALQVGYRHVDTASMYGNESEVGDALGASSLDRNEVFVTTKIWNDDHGFDRSARALEASRRRLGLNPIDLALIHWPGERDRLDTWRQLETQLANGALRAIGVSNYGPGDLDELGAVASVTPMVNQIEFNPMMYQRQLPTLERCRADGIQVTAWRPLLKGQGLDHPTIVKVANGVGRTPAQVLLRWAIQHGVVPLPKSSSRERMSENIDVFDFELSPHNMDLLNALGRM